LRISLPYHDLRMPPEDHGGVRDIAKGSGGYQEGRVSVHIKADGGLITVAIYGRSLLP